MSTRTAQSVTRLVAILAERANQADAEQEALILQTMHQLLDVLDAMDGA